MLIFCKECATLMDPPSASEDIVFCHVCNSSISAKEFENISVVTYSTSSAFPHRPRKDTETAELFGLKDGATIQERCPNPDCDNTEMVFHTAQLRSADEGQTVFYNCVKCGFKYSINS